METEKKILLNSIYAGYIYDAMAITTSYTTLYETTSGEGATKTAELSLAFVKLARDSLERAIATPFVGEHRLGEVPLYLKKEVTDKIQTIDRLLEKANEQ